VLHAPGATGGLEVVDPQGRRIVSGRRFAIVVSSTAGECLPARHLCGPGGCTRVVLATPSRDHHEALATAP
jgi:hypothetical protein